VIYSRRVAVRRAQLQLQPLARAHAVRLRTELIRDMVEERKKANEGSNFRPSPATLEQRKGLFLKMNMQETVRRNRRWGVQKWKDWVPSLMVFPFWVVGIEALRRLWGGPRGWLGTFVLGPPKKPEPDGAVAPEGSSGAGVGGGRTGGIEGQVQEVVHSDVDLSSLATEQADVQEALASAVSAAGPDMSMATGGCLWFPDLMAADPYHVLPLALSAILVMNLVPKSRVGLRALLNLDTTPEATVGTSKWRLRMHRGFLVVATSAGFLTMDLPAALHLYWVTSAALTWAQTSIVWKLMPLPKQVPAAKQQERPIVPPPPKETETAAMKSV
jgi:inner membrane protein COX18